MSSETNNSYLESMIKSLEQEQVPWDKDDNSSDMLEDTPIVLQAAYNQKEDFPQYQIYLKSSLKNNNLFRIPISNQATKEDALVAAYNLLADMLDAIAEEINKDND